MKHARDKHLDMHAPTHCLTLVNIPSRKTTPGMRAALAAPHARPLQRAVRACTCRAPVGTPDVKVSLSLTSTACLHSHISSTEQNRTHVAGLHSPCFAVSTPRHLLHCRSLRSRIAPPDHALQRGSTPHHRGHTQGRRATLNPPPCRRAAALQSRLTLGQLCPHQAAPKP